MFFCVREGVRSNTFLTQHFCLVLTLAVLRYPIPFRRRHSWRIASGMLNSYMGDQSRPNVTSYFLIFHQGSMLTVWVMAHLSELF